MKHWMDAVSNFVGAVMRSADKEELEGEDDFQPCPECDGHDACRDFGCAIKLGLGSMARQNRQRRVLFSKEDNK